MISGTRQLYGRRIGLLLAALTAALLAAFALVLMASNNPAQAKPSIVEVPAATDLPGKDTEINIDAGDRVVIKANGTAHDGTQLGGEVDLFCDPTLSPACPDPGPVPGSEFNNVDTPDGIPDTDGVTGAVLESANIGALLGRIGTSGDWFLVGSGKSFTAQKSGRLYLIVNDTDRNNAGQFKAEIDVVHPDTLGPRVSSTVPTSGATGLGPNANAKANFSEDMRASSINGQSVKLFKMGSTNKVDAAVSYNASMDRAILNPKNPLQRGATYRAVVTTGAKDKAGNSLDQNRSLSGLQQKSWAFTISD